LTALGAGNGHAGSLWVASMRRGRDERRQMLESAAALYTRGVSIDWVQVAGGHRGRRVALPTYPFQRERYWWTDAAPSTPVGGVTPSEEGDDPARTGALSAGPPPTACQALSPLGDGPNEGSQAIRQQFAMAAPGERLELLVRYVRERVATVLRVDPTRAIDRGQRLMDMGLDSLMAVELRSLLGVGLGLERQLPVTLMFDHPTIDSIARYLDRDVLPSPAAVEEPAPVITAAPASARVDAIAAMSDEEVADLLMKRLETL
jgi:acyl transferase domain-containing protein